MAFTTSKSLLIKVRNGDEISWSEFYKTYQGLGGNGQAQEYYELV